MNSESPGSAEEPTDISYDMLRSTEGQLNAVFACFGSAAQHAQRFESALAEFLQVYNRIANASLTPQDFEALDQKLQKKTMGALLRDLSKFVTIDDPKVTRTLELSLEKRNFLMHHFFLDREAKFQTEADRMAMLAELLDIQNLLETAARVTGGMRIALLRATSGHASANDEPGLFQITVQIPDGLPTGPK